MGLFTKRLKSSDNSTQDDGKAQSGCCAPITFEEEDETPAARPS